MDGGNLIWFLLGAVVGAFVVAAIAAVLIDRSTRW